MNSRTRLFTATTLFFAAALALGESPAVFRIALRDGSTVLAKDRPTPRGSVLLFHRHPDGRLTSVPREELAGTGAGAAAARGEDVVSVTAGALEARPPMLRPGEVVVLGPTAPGREPAPAPARSGPAPATVSGGAYDPRNPTYGYSPGNAANPPSVSSASGVVAPLAPGDVARAISAEPLSLEPSIGNNGLPTTVPGSAAPLIGSDGQPILSPAGAPGSTPPTIGPSGTPALSTPGAPGSAPPVVGPNGTPVLAPAGAPGSTPPTTGPNGYPAARAPGR